MLTLLDLLKRRLMICEVAVYIVHKRIMVFVDYPMVFFLQGRCCCCHWVFFDLFGEILEGGLETRQYNVDFLLFCANCGSEGDVWCWVGRVVCAVGGEF